MRWHDRKCVPTLRCGRTVRSAQKECLLLRSKEDDGQEVMGSQIDGQEGSGMKGRRLMTGDSENSST